MVPSHAASVSRTGARAMAAVLVEEGALSAPVVLEGAGVSGVWGLSITVVPLAVIVRKNAWACIDIDIYLCVRVCVCVVGGVFTKKKIWSRSSSNGLAQDHRKMRQTLPYLQSRPIACVSILCLNSTLSEKDHSSPPPFPLPIGHEVWGQCTSKYIRWRHSLP